MTWFQLVFRHPDGDRHEIHDNSLDGHPHIDGKPLVDRERFVIRGVDYLVRREDIGDIPRFVCTPVAQPSRRRADPAAADGPDAHEHDLRSMFNRPDD